MNDEVTRRLAELVELHRLPSDAQAQLAAIVEQIASDERVPTSVRDPLLAADVHVADSLAGLAVDALRRAKRVADLGSGAGFPGLPLAVALPCSTLSLVESQARKCAFLGRLVNSAGLANVKVVNLRAEEWAAGANAHDAVVARAIAPAAVVQEYAAPLLKPGGVLVDWRGRRDRGEEHAASAAAAALGLERIEIRHVQPFSAAEEHHLHIYLKVAPTPERFPRRPGIAAKRPLGSARGRAAATGDRGRL